LIACVEESVMVAFEVVGHSTPCVLSSLRRTGSPEIDVLRLGDDPGDCPWGLCFAVPLHLLLRVRALDRAWPD
jgi:hypothetical protein